MKDGKVLVEEQEGELLLLQDNVVEERGLGEERWWCRTRPPVLSRS